MKTKAFLFILPLAAALALSCTREIIDPATEMATVAAETGGQEVLVPFTVEAGAPETRVAVSGSTTNIVFSEGDQLMVYCWKIVEPSILTLKSGAGQRSATFTGYLTLSAGKTQADLAGKTLQASLIPQEGVSQGVFSYDPAGKRLTVDYSTKCIDSDLDALFSRTAIYQGTTKYEDRRFEFRLLTSYLKMNVTVPSEESSLARDYTVAVTYDYHIRSKASNSGMGWGGENEAATVSGTFRASNSTSGTAYLAILADKSMRIEDDDVMYDEVKIQVGMDNVYKEYGLTGGVIDHQVIVPGKGYTKAVTLKDPDNEDVLLGQPTSVRTRIMSGLHADKNSNGRVSKYEAAQVKSFRMYGNQDLTNASFFGYFNGLTTLEDETFIGCDKMTKVILPKYITAIGSSAFEGCLKLGSVIIPSGVTSLGNLAFNNCTDLSRIVIPSSVTTIGESAFQFCSDMTEVVFETPARIATIGENAFKKCTSLEDFYVPHGVTAIAANTFEGCTSLKSVSMTSSVTSIGASAFAGCSVLDDVYIPAQVTSIGIAAFKDCEGMKTIHLPNRLSSIEVETFSGCTSLQGIEIPQTVKSISRQAFSYCSTIATVTIPPLVENMGIRAFEHCSSLRTVYCYPIVPPQGNGSNDSGFFTGCSSLTIYVPAESVSTYKSHIDWQYWKGIIQPM